MIYQATHITRYLYEQPVSQCLSEAHLRPRSFPGQKLHTSRIRVQPEPAVFEERKDYFGNDVNTFAVLRSHDQLTTTAMSVVEVAPVEGPSRPDAPWEAVRDALSAEKDEGSLEALEFTF